VTAPEGLLDLEPAKLKSLKLGVIGQTRGGLLLRHRCSIRSSPINSSPATRSAIGEIVEKDLVAGSRCRVVWGPSPATSRRTPRPPLAVVPFERLPGFS